jgi:hypothetical protein
MELEALVRRSCRTPHPSAAGLPESLPEFFSVFQLNPVIKFQDNLIDMVFCPRYTIFVFSIFT